MTNAENKPKDETTQDAFGGRITGNEYAIALYEELLKDDAENPHARIPVRIHGIITRAFRRAHAGEFGA